MTTPPTDPPRLSDEELDRVYETLSYGSSTVDRDACRAIDQLRTSLAAANKRAEEAEADAELNAGLCASALKKAGEARTQLAEARELLKQAIPFIGWANMPDGLVERCHEFVDSLTQDNNEENTDDN